MNAIKIILSLPLLLLLGCGGELEKKDKPGFSFFPNMHVQPHVMAQQEALNLSEGEEGKRSMREPVEGTVPSEFTHYPYQKMDMKAGDLKNPLPRTSEVLKAGRRNYNIYCIVCHGERGDGDGKIIPAPDGKKLYGGRVKKFENHFFTPPPLHHEMYIAKKDGQLFNTITRGGALMPPYGHISVEQRWAIVHYLRVLQKASHASEEELKDYENQKENFIDPDPTVIVKWKNK